MKQDVRKKEGEAVKAVNIGLNAVIASGSGELIEEALELFVGKAREAIETRGRFCAAISRHIPGAFFERLGEQSQSKALLWEKIHLFWVDQCCGCPDSENNNYKTAVEKFILKVDMPVQNIHSISSENRNCGYVASIYEQTIYNVVGQEKNQIPQFDLIMLGMSADGHIASLFPDSYAFFDTDDLVRVIYFMDKRHTRITLTNSVLRAAYHIAVLVCGEKRATILREVLTCEADEVRYPIHAIWPILDKVMWLVDRNALKFLQPCYLLNESVPRNLRFIEFYKRL
ncbi:MAG: 6-phosphogluconolactonase [Planctomycetota bacterium]|jgi:6-phosphogluconolactonase